VDSKNTLRGLGESSAEDLELTRSSLEWLAAHCRCPIETVEQLYTRELRLLRAEAKIRTFVPIVAFRRVREALREREKRLGR
jgi:hypothetical protein